MADPVVEFVSDWIAENVTPEVTDEDVDPQAVQEQLSLLLAEARDEGISEEDIEESGLDVASLIEAALTPGSDAADEGDAEE